MRSGYWRAVAGLLLVLVVALPALGVTGTRLGTLQVLYALALVALLLRLVWLARRRHAASGLH